jgi:hypothetical protein
LRCASSGDYQDHPKEDQDSQHDKDHFHQPEQVPCRMRVVADLPAARGSNWFGSDWVGTAPASCTGGRNIRGCGSVVPTSSSRSHILITETTSCIALYNRLAAFSNSMTHLATVGALDFGPIFGLRALAGKMAHLITYTKMSALLLNHDRELGQPTVAALNRCRIARLVALSSHVILTAAVAASTRLRLNVGALSRHMSHFVALATLHVGHVRRFGAVSGFVAGLTAATTGIAIDTWIRAVTSAMSDFRTIDAYFHQ